MIYFEPLIGWIFFSDEKLYTILFVPVHIENAGAGKCGVQGNV